MKKNKYVAIILNVLSLVLIFPFHIVYLGDRKTLKIRSYFWLILLLIPMFVMFVSLFDKSMVFSETYKMFLPFSIWSVVDLFKLIKLSDYDFYKKYNTKFDPSVGRYRFLTVFFGLFLANKVYVGNFKGILRTIVFALVVNFMYSKQVFDFQYVWVGLLISYIYDVYMVLNLSTLEFKRDNRKTWVLKKYGVNI